MDWNERIFFRGFARNAAGRCKVRATPFEDGVAVSERPLRARVEIGSSGKEGGLRESLAALLSQRLEKCEGCRSRDAATLTASWYLLLA